MVSQHVQIHRVPLFGFLVYCWATYESYPSVVVRNYEVLDDFSQANLIVYEHTGSTVELVCNTNCVERSIPSQVLPQTHRPNEGPNIAAHGDESIDVVLSDEFVQNVALRPEQVIRV